MPSFGEKFFKSIKKNRKFLGYAGLGLTSAAIVDAKRYHSRLQNQYNVIYSVNNRIQEALHGKGGALHSIEALGIAQSGAKNSERLLASYEKTSKINPLRLVAECLLACSVVSQSDCSSSVKGSYAWPMGIPIIQLTAQANYQAGVLTFLQRHLNSDIVVLQSARQHFARANELLLQEQPQHLQEKWALELCRTATAIAQVDLTQSGG